jgi:hypothetical protein
LVGNNTAHFSFSRQWTVAHGAGGLNPMMNRKASSFAALTPHQGTGLVDGKEEGDVSTASLCDGCHPSKRKGAG